jgi:hypothetical protein
MAKSAHKLYGKKFQSPAIVQFSIKINEKMTSNAASG